MIKTILIADASLVMRRVIERSLRLAGLESGRVIEASDGAEALAVTQRQRLDLVLTELNLPNLSGLDLLRQLREQETTKDLPVVIVSSQAGQSAVLEALHLGARGFLRKPFTVDQMKEYVTSLLQLPHIA